MLFLGTGETGKSTMVKQLRIILGGGIDEVERQTFASTVYINVFSNTIELLQSCKKLDLRLPEELEMFGKQLLAAQASASRMDSLDMATAQKIEQLWHTDAFKEAFSKRSQFGLSDSTEYTFQNIIRFAQPDFTPTSDDFIHLRQRTSGISEYHFPLSTSSRLTVIDVGGQRSERRKWLHCFSNVTAVAFFVALSDYDLMLREDLSVNRLQESLIVFREITSGPWFKSINKILFLNKKDLFKEKIQRVDIRCCFPEYKGAQTYNEGLQFIQNIILSIASGQHIFVHVTCATSRKNVEFVFNSIRSILLDQSLTSL